MVDNEKPGQTDEEFWDEVREEVRKRRPVEDDPAAAEVMARYGAQFLSKMKHDPPPRLLAERLDPEHTILYGTGGSGKGTLACRWLLDLVAEGHRVLILDYEGHGDEWSRRIYGLGGPQPDIIHVAPLGPDWSGEKGPMWAQADDIRILCEALHITYIVIDSIVPACHGHDVMKPETPGLYLAGLQTIERPSLSLGHITKADQSLAYVFGSVMWHNLVARGSWSLHREPGEGGGTTVLTHQKNNNGPKLGRFVVAAHYEDGVPKEVHDKTGYSEALLTRIVRVLKRTPWLSAADIVKALDEDASGEQPAKVASVRTTLNRQIGEMVKGPRMTITDGLWALAGTPPKGQTRPADDEDDDLDLGLDDR